MKLFSVLGGMPMLWDWPEPGPSHPSGGKSPHHRKRGPGRRHRNGDGHSIGKAARFIGRQGLRS